MSERNLVYIYFTTKPTTVVEESGWTFTTDPKIKGADLWPTIFMAKTGYLMSINKEMLPEDQEFVIDYESYKQKIIFLDIDGVLNLSFKEADDFIFFEENSMDCVSKKLIVNLNELIQKTNADVVISSTWRKIYTIEQLKEFFERAGFKGNIIGITPDFNYPGSCRGSEIDYWLKTNFGYGSNAGSLANYVILDDDSDMLLNQKDNFICVDYTVGLTKKNVFKAANILNGVKFL